MCHPSLIPSHAAALARALACARRHVATVFGCETAPSQSAETSEEEESPLAGMLLDVVEHEWLALCKVVRYLLLRRLSQRLGDGSAELAIFEAPSIRACQTLSSASLSLVPVRVPSPGTPRGVRLFAWLQDDFLCLVTPHEEEHVKVLMAVPMHALTAREDGINTLSLRIRAPHKPHASCRIVEGTHDRPQWLLRLAFFGDDMALRTTLAFVQHHRTRRRRQMLRQLRALFAGESTAPPAGAAEHVGPTDSQPRK
ncbi:MAG: hypothetical protein MHM6MM_001992 [Cercozoa sp. M6MM]